MRNRRLIHIQILADFRHTLLAVKQIVQNPDSGGIPEDLEQLRQLAKLVLADIGNDVLDFLSIVLLLFRHPPSFISISVHMSILSYVHELSIVMCKEYKNRYPADKICRIPGECKILYSGNCYTQLTILPELSKLWVTPSM